MAKTQNNIQQAKKGGPGGPLWLLRRFGWVLEKYLLWPVSDSFRWFFRQLGRIPNAFRYRSPLAYIGATLMITVTAGAIAAAVYFYNQSEEKDQDPTVATTAVPTETVVPSVPTPTTTPTTVEDTTPDSGNSETTLQGVVPNFTTSRKTKNGKKNGGSDQKLPNTVVRPAAVPKSPPLRVAHKFATTFVGYEIGEDGAARKFAKTATPKLAKELRQNPPKLPSNGQIPKATVVNVVAGKKTGDNLEVSVSLMRSGAASELRLDLTRDKGDGWLVSEVRG